MDEASYNGSQQYAKAKRAQVTLNEMWARAVPRPRGRVPRDAPRLGRHPGRRSVAADVPPRRRSVPAHAATKAPTRWCGWPPTTASRSRPRAASGSTVASARSTGSGAPTRSDTPARRARALGLGRGRERLDARRHAQRMPSEPVGRRPRSIRAAWSWSPARRVRRRSARHRAARGRATACGASCARPRRSRARRGPTGSRSSRATCSRISTPRWTGVAAVYYLVHTIGASADWVERDVRYLVDDVTTSQPGFGTKSSTAGVLICTTEVGTVRSARRAPSSDGRR